ncbi:hypothetical protein NW761_014399 [Fusarium oxysporum]|nr:hypothetical protein NW758_014012 [Fusarium oxysporum]KAJ4073076.1 hypothetical protein NW761_014399 [Fusarium oxysporum]
MLMPANPGDPATVVVESPKLYTTVTNYGSYTAAVTSTLAPASQGDVATVVVGLPQSYTTVTSYGSFAAVGTTTLAPASQGGVATVIIQEPQPYTTVTSWGSFSTVSTTTHSPISQGGVATVVVQEPQHYTTVTSWGSFSAAHTTTFSPTSPGGTGTVVVQNPQPYTTVTSWGSFSTVSTTTYSPISQGGVATVVVQQPQSYTTVTSWGTFSAAGTTTLSPTSPGGVATVVMQKPQPYTTVTTYYTTVSSVSTSTGTPASAGQTATVVVVAPAVGTKAADQTCNNAGLEYAIYTNPFYNADPPNYSALNVSYFATSAPTYTGITKSIGITEPGGVKAGNSGPAQAIYPGSPSQTWQYKAVNHRAFLYAPINGTYSVVVPYSDEVTLVWVGDKALSTWSRARSSADLAQNYSSGPSSSMTFKIQLTAGTYTPFRVFWANAQGDYSMIVTVTAPDGTVIVDGSGSSSKYFIRFACDSSTPSYPAFGSGG